MKCPHCSFDNKDDAPFCEKCGHVFLASDRIPRVPDPADQSRRRDAALGSVPPVVKVPDIAPSTTGSARPVVPDVSPATTGSSRPAVAAASVPDPAAPTRAAGPDATVPARPVVPEVVPAAPASVSVADLADPLPDLPGEPDFSGFERLVDSSYVPPAAAGSAGDTAEIPVIRDEYVPRPRNYTLGLSPREQKKRDREQRKLEKKFARAQKKEQARAAREESRAAADAAREERRAAAAAEREERLAAAAAARAERKAARADEAAAGADELVADEAVLAGATGVAAVLDAEAPGGSNAPDSAAPAAEGGTRELPWSRAAAGEGPLTVPVAPDDLSAVLKQGDGVVDLFEKAGRRHGARSVTAGRDDRDGSADGEGADAPSSTAALELPGAEQGLVLAGERGIESVSAEGEPPSPDATAALASASAEGGLEVAGRAAIERADATRALSPDALGPDAPRDASVPAPARAEEPAATAAATAAPAATAAATAATAAAPGPSKAARPEPESKSKPRTASTKASDGKARSCAAAEVSKARRPRSKAPLIAGAAVVVVLALAGAVGGTYLAELWGGKIVPAVVGLTLPEAEAALAEKGFSAEATEVKSDEAAGTVLSATPGGGGRAEEGSTVALEVAAPRVVPDIVGLTQQEAEAACAAEGLTNVDFAEKKSNEAEGAVLSVEPAAGTELLSTDPVTATVAVPFTVPDVEGKTAEEAEAALEADGYEATVRYRYTEDVEEGTALGTDPEAGTKLDSGSEVTLLVAKSRAAELREKTAAVLPGAILKTAEASYKVEEVVSTTWRGYTDDGGGEVGYKVKARKFEVVNLPFDLGQETYYDKTVEEVEGGLVWNERDKISYSNPDITLP